jgi:hypothetical protein
MRNSAENEAFSDIALHRRKGSVGIAAKMREPLERHLPGPRIPLDSAIFYPKVPK